MQTITKYVLSYLILIISCKEVKGQHSSLNCNLDEYHNQKGLTAESTGEVLTINWDGDHGNTVRISFSLISNTPVIKEMAIMPEEGQWQVLATNMAPEYRIVSGIRRVTQQQTEPLERIGIPLTEEKLNEIKWNAYWDAPLFLEDEMPATHQTAIPSAEPFLSQSGLPRSTDEVTRANANFHTTGCEVRTNGHRLEIIFPGVTAGIFEEGHLRYDIYKGSNLIRQMLAAKTNHPSAAFKYDTGLTNLPIQKSTRLMWRDLANQWQDHQLGNPVNNEPVVVTGQNRLIAVETDNGSLVTFPPPHTFYWSRQSEQILGYSWYRKDSENTFSFGMRQAEFEKDPAFHQNFALYSARPGTWQRMPVFIYLSSDSGKNAIENVLEFTNGDNFRSLEEYKVMGHHYHAGLLPRLQEKGFDQRLNDVETMKSVGMDIYSVIDGVRGPGRYDTGDLFLEELSAYYETARWQSDKNFLVMPNDENTTRERKPIMGGHYDIMYSKPVHWRPERKPGDPLYEDHAKYGTVYNLGTPEDMMAMTERENALISMPHPETKRSTGFLNEIINEPHFLHENYFSLGFRWGTGIDASERRLSEYRFLNAWNEVNNSVTSLGYPPKFALAISETRSDITERGKPPYDDTYGMSPVNYLKMDSVPSPDDMSPVINALRAGDYFITTGEILIPYYEVRGTGNDRTVIAELEWTFPLEFVELVWGDGEEIGRDIISATHLPPFGEKRFEIPFDASGKKWIRFAAWDVANNGALLQPVSLIER